MRRILLAIGLLAALNGASVHSETMASSVESARDQPSVATITGEVRGPRSREITFHYESPSALENSEQRVALDSLDRFAFELPVVRGTLVSGHFEDWQPRWKWVQWLDAFFSDPNSLTLFVEPGDSLHVVVKEGFFGRSYSFSGSNPDNSRFTSKWIPQSRPLRLEYKGLEVEDFKRQMEQWRRDQFEFLTSGREQYALSSGCIDYVTDYVNYEWANRMMSYPMNYRFANGRENRDITPEYHDFLQEFPLVDEKAIGVAQYRWFLERTLSWGEDHDHDDNPKLSKMCDLSGLELSEETQAQLDSLYEKDGRQPVLSKMVALSAFGVAASAQAQVDSLYEKDGRWLKLSEQYALSAFGVAASAQAQLDSLYEKSERSLNIYPLLSEEEKSPRADTTDGALVFYIPRGVRLDSLAKEPPKLSAKIDLSGLGLSEAAQAQLDSLYEHRQPLELSAKIDLSGLGLSEAAQAQLDSIYAGKRQWFGPTRSDLAKEKLEGRVLYWFLAGELINRFKRSGSRGFAAAQREWEEFQQINPHPEYNEAVQAVLDIALKLQPGQPAPEFTLPDLDDQPVSLSQFKGQVVLLDFWASWCGPCIDDLPYLRQVKEKTADWPVVFLNISLDADDAAWREAIDKHEIKGVHVRADGWGAEVAKTYQVMGIPSYYLVDSQGLIVEDSGLRSNTDATVAAIEKSL
ncbi:MAG: TlpA disulfide reductase family protein [Gemmatimonadetes bacterium]|nr:TlpA disulfide reductase family protein [Gemmatimonadota bacterium]